MAALLNTYGYYHQFLPAVKTAIDDLASPVEKEFKVWIIILETLYYVVLYVQEYLKILRWNDGNYWAIRQATIRSHRSLVKYMNKYKVVVVSITLHCSDACVSRIFWLILCNQCSQPHL